VKLSYLSLSFAAAVLGFVVVVQTGLVAPKLSCKTARRSLQQSLPENLPGWSVQELPLGPTEMDRTAISRSLNFDQLIYRRYSSAKGSFCLYAAYWAPQRMSPNLVGGHTPDRCWVGSGWTCEASSFSWKSRLGDKELLPAQYRLFRDAMGRTQQVIYWHLVGGKPFEGDYRIDGSRSIAAYWKAILLHHAGGNTEQFFIRLNSERPFEQLWNDPGFRMLMESLAGLCLGESDGQHPGSP
jgi:hypothetical protein